MCTAVVDLHVVKVIAQAECMFEGKHLKIVLSKVFLPDFVVLASSPLSSGCLEWGNGVCALFLSL